MLYMLLINYDPSIPFEGPMLQPKHAALEIELREKGQFVSGAGLMPVEQGSTRVRNGKALKTEGPFAESKEVAGGYYMHDQVRRLLGYAGQEALTLSRGGFGGEDLIDPMLARGPIYREAS